MESHMQRIDIVIGFAFGIIDMQDAKYHRTLPRSRGPSA